MSERYYTRIEPSGSQQLLFTAEMRRATRKIHSISDTLVNSKLVLALSDESVWTDALLVFHEIFKYLENSRDELNMPEMNALFVDTILYRTDAFKADLDHYLGKGWENAYVRRKAISEYLEHLKELKEERPILLCAYIYHLYMGLLSGGQIIKAKREFREMTSNRIFRSNNSRPDYVDTILDFSGTDIADLKKKIKTAMNDIAADWTSEQRCAFINESQMVFFHNNQIVKTVRGTFKAIVWMIFYIFILALIILFYYFFL